MSSKDKKQESKKQITAKVPPRPNIMFTTKNYVLFIIGLVTIGIGYLLLSKGSITLAPILLVLGYVIIIPLSIIIK